MKKIVYIIIIYAFAFNTFADINNKITPDIEKNFIKSLRFAAIRKDKKSLDKIALEMEKYYCCSPNYEKGFTAVRKSSFLIEQGKYQQAVNSINILLEKNKADSNEIALNVAMILKGKALLELDKVKQALETFKKVGRNRKINCKDVPEIYWINVLYCSATCEELLKNYSNALYCYEEFLSAYKKFYNQVPFNESYLYRAMGRCCRELKNYDKAYKYFRLGMKCAPDEYSKAMIAGSLGMTYQKQKKLLKAIECYDKSLEYFFSKKEAFAKYIAKISLAKAKVLIVVGEKDEAIKCLQEALKAPCPECFVKEINKLISGLQKS